MLSPPVAWSITLSSAMCHGKTTWARSLSIMLLPTSIPWAASESISLRIVGGLMTTPGVTTFITPGVRMPLGTWCSL